MRCRLSVSVSASASAIPSLQQGFRILANWQREIHAAYRDASVAIQTLRDDAQWTLVNFERLEAHVAIAERYQVMIVDEARMMKEPTAAWTRSGFDIAAQLPNPYLLTGTPVLNREAELYTLLRLSGHPVGQLPLKDFCGRFADSPEFRQNLRTETQDLDALRRLLEQLRLNTHRRYSQR